MMGVIVKFVMLAYTSSSHQHEHIAIIGSTIVSSTILCSSALIIVCRVMGQQ